MRGKDIYKSLTDIKIEFFNFQKKYQNCRLTYLHKANKLDDEGHKRVTIMYENWSKQLIEGYDKLDDCINRYRVIRINNDGYLEEQLNRLWGLIIEYNTSYKLYYDHISKKQLLDQENLERCESNLFKTNLEDDEVSKNVKKIVQDAFMQINEALKKYN